MAASGGDHTDGDINRLDSEAQTHGVQDGENGH
jgi:hypothetical protein